MKRDKETGDSVVTGFGFESDRLRFWRGCFGTITDSSMARTMHFHFRHLLNTALLLSVILHHVPGFLSQKRTRSFWTQEKKKQRMHRARIIGNTCSNETIKSLI